MDIELAPERLRSKDIDAIGSSALTQGRLCLSGVLALLCHIEWQSEEIERLGEERDGLRDAQDVQGIPASKAKRTLNELADAQALLADIRAALDIPEAADPVDAVKSLQIVRQRQAEHLRTVNAKAQEAQNALADVFYRW
jgi:hypothetical protein